MKKSVAVIKREISQILGDVSPGKGRDGYDVDEAWRVATAPGGSGSVVDLEAGGYAVPKNKGTMAPPSRTRPIQARVPRGWVKILPGPHGAWRIVR